MVSSSADALRATANQKEQTQKRSNTRREKKWRKLARLTNTYTHQHYRPPSRPPLDKETRSNVKKRKRRSGRGSGRRRSNQLSTIEGPISPPPSDNAGIEEAPAASQPSRPSQPIPLASQTVAPSSTEQQQPLPTRFSLQELEAMSTQQPRFHPSSQPSFINPHTFDVHPSFVQQRPPSSSSSSQTHDHTPIKQESTPFSYPPRSTEPQINPSQSIGHQQSLSSSYTSLLVSQPLDHHHLSQHQQQYLQPQHPPPQVADFDSAYFALTGRERFTSRTPVHDYNTVAYPALSNASTLHNPYSSLPMTETNQGRWSRFDHTPSPVTSEDESQFYTPLTRFNAHRSTEEQHRFLTPPMLTTSLDPLPPLQPYIPPPNASFAYHPYVPYSISGFNPFTPSLTIPEAPAASLDEVPKFEASVPMQQPQHRISLTTTEALTTAIHELPKSESSIQAQQPQQPPSPTIPEALSATIEDIPKSDFPVHAAQPPKHIITEELVGTIKEPPPSEAPVLSQQPSRPSTSVISEAPVTTIEGVSQSESPASAQAPIQPASHIIPEAPHATVEELPQSEAPMPSQLPSRPPSPRVVIISPSKAKRKMYTRIEEEDDTEDKHADVDTVPTSVSPIKQTPHRNKRLKSALVSSDKPSSKRKSVRFTGTRSRHLNSPTPSPKKSRTPAGASCLPFADITNAQFGLIHEKLWDKPYDLLLAVIFLNRTKGSASVGVFYKVKEAYPEPKDLAIADPDVVEAMIRHLGFGEQRTKTIITLSQEWVEDEPRKGRRHRHLHYPTPESGTNIRPHEILDDVDARDGAFEVAHLRGVGPYAMDSWRIFCRDVLRGLASGYNGEGAKDGFEPEWKRVLPSDKELRVYLKWMWLKEGWDWNPLTGNRQPILVNDALVLAERVNLRNSIEQPSPPSTPEKRKFDADVEDESASMTARKKNIGLSDMTDSYDEHDWIPASVQRPKPEPVVVVESPRTSPAKEQPYVLPTGESRIAIVADRADDWCPTIASNELKVNEWLEQVPASSPTDDNSSALAPVSDDTIVVNSSALHIQDAKAERAKAKKERKERREMMRKRKRDKQHSERKLTIREPTDEELAIFREVHGREWDGGLDPNADWVRQHK